VDLTGLVVPTRGGQDLGFRAQVTWYLPGGAGFAKRCGTKPGLHVEEGTSPKPEWCFLRRNCAFFGWGMQVGGVQGSCRTNRGLGEGGWMI